MAAIFIVMHGTPSMTSSSWCWRTSISASATPDPDPVLPEIVSAAQQVAPTEEHFWSRSSPQQQPHHQVHRQPDRHQADGSRDRARPIARNKEVARSDGGPARRPQAAPDRAARQPRRPVSAAEPYHPSVIYYVGFGLSATGAANAQIQMHSISAAHAVEEIADQLPDLTDAQLHARFTSAAGAQAPLTSPSQASRTQ